MSSDISTPADMPVVASKARKIIFFEDRAEVIRTASFEAPEGVGWIAIDGVTPFVDESSVRASVQDAGIKILATRVVWRAHTTGAVGSEEIDRLERQADEAWRRVSACDLAVERAQQQESRAEGLIQRVAEALEKAPLGIADAPVRDEWKQAYGLLDKAALEALARQARELAARAEMRFAATRASTRVNEAAMDRPRVEARIAFQIEAESSARATLEVTYRVPCALWRPEHLARLSSTSPVGGEARIDLVTYAVAWQRTGEVWSDVEASFSTARPARAATAPELCDDALEVRRKTDADRQRVIVEVRDQDVTVAGVEGGVKTVEEMPGVDDGGEPVSFDVKGKMTFASDGRPLRVRVSRMTMPAKVDRILIAERSGAAHVRAVATLTGDVALLAGPVHVARGASLVGRSRTDFVARGEAFELGFGADDGVRVRREQAEERDTTALTGAQRVHRIVRLYLSNLSDETKRVRVKERVPISEVQEVQVEVDEQDGWSLDSRDGFATTSVELAARASAQLELRYEIRASSRVQLPF